MIAKFVRLLRTASSERFLVQTAAGQDAAALDIHYLADSRVAGTLCLFDDSGISESQIPDVLQQIDEVLLPDVSFKDRNLSFTVVAGRVVGSFMFSRIPILGSLARRGFT